MKAVVAAFNEEKALVGAFSVITNLQMDLRFKLLKRKCDIFQFVSCHLVEHVEEAAQLHHAEVDVLGYCVGDLRGAPHVHQVQLRNFLAAADTNIILQTSDILRLPHEARAAP